MTQSMKTIGLAVLGGCAALALAAGPAAADDMKPWYPFKVQVWDPPFDMASPRKDIDYVPLEKADKKWDICVSFPHMKDAYWLAVDYGVVEESKRLGVKMQLVEAGGYTNLNKQISQIEDCVAAGAQGVVIGAISFDGLNNLVSEIRRARTSRSSTSSTASPRRSCPPSRWCRSARWAPRPASTWPSCIPAGSGKVKVAWFPGPPGAGWVEAGNTGFLDAVKGSAIEVVETKYGDTGKEVQLKLVEDTLEANPDITYIVGTSPTAEAAIGLLKDRGLTDKIKVLAYYFTPPRLSGHQGRLASWRRRPTRR